MGPSQRRYELLDFVGAGGMAQVFRARLTGEDGTARLVALKRLLPQLTDDPQCINRFVDEARLMAHLAHPNICRILDFGTMEESYFITLEYVDGLDLAGLLRELDQRHETLPFDICLSIVVHVLRGLQYAHEATDQQGQPLGLVHRDVSPQNVLLSTLGEVKLADLGAATAVPSVRTARTHNNMRVGKVLYMAPEQRRMQRVDARADIYSVGVMLVEMLVGMKEFQGQANMFLAGLHTFTEVLTERFSEPWVWPLCEMVERAVVEDVTLRYRNATEMKSALEGLLGDLGFSASTERVGRLVGRAKDQRLDRQSRPPPVKGKEAETTSLVSLCTGTVHPLNIPQPMRDLVYRTESGDDDIGLDDATTRVHRRGSFPPGTLGRVSEEPSRPSVPPATERPRRRLGRNLAFAVLVVVTVATTGVAVGAFLADRVFVPPGETISDAELLIVEQHGMLRIRTPTEAELFLDGAPLSRDQLERAFPVQAGHHAIEGFFPEKNERVSRRVLVRPGEVTEVTLNPVVTTHENPPPEAGTVYP